MFPLRKDKNIMKKYTIEDARREVQEMIADGESWGYIRIFLNDLARGGDITWQDREQLANEIIDSGYDCSYKTFSA